MKENERKCCKCGRSPAQDPSISLHRFPKPGRTNSLRCELWAKYCFPHESWSTPEFQNKLHSMHLMLCTKHFKNSSFIDNSGKRLFKSAAPDVEYDKVETPLVVSLQMAVDQPNPCTSFNCPPGLPEYEEMQVPEDEEEDNRSLASLTQTTRRAVRLRRASTPVSPGSRSRSPHVARHLSPRPTCQLPTGAIMFYNEAGEQIITEGTRNGRRDAGALVCEDVSSALNYHALYPEMMLMTEHGRSRQRISARARRERSGHRDVRWVSRAGQARKERRVVSWLVGDPIEEVFKTDDDIDPCVLRIAAEDEIKRKEIIRANASSGRVVREARRVRDIDENDSDNDNDGVSVIEDDDTVEGGETGQTFEWFPFSEAFRGEEEVFRVQRTGSVNVHDSPYSAFRSLWPDEVLEHIVSQTNLYAAKLGRTCPHFAQTWYDTNVDEILCLFAFWMMLGIIRMPTIEDCFSTDSLMQTEVFRKLFTKDRYKRMSRALHFVESDSSEYNSANPPSVTDADVAEDQMNRLRPIIKFLNLTFQTNYILSKNICIDESLTLWKGKLSIIRSKAAKFKSFELCESSTGYLWAFRYYTGNLPTQDVLPMGVNKSTGIIMELMTPLLQKGHQLYMDNWYNSPALARWLKRNGIDCVGTLRLNRSDVPSLFSRVPLHQSQFIARHSGDVCLLSWQDKKRITALSTYHKNHTALAHVYSKKPNRPLPYKPQVVLDYNRCMGGVDMKNQMLEPYLIAQKNGKKRYVNLFKRLVNCSILNSRIIYSSSKNKPQPHLTFRKQLVRDIMARHLQKIPCPRSRQNTHASVSHTSNLQPAIPNGHWPQAIPNRRRCVVCYRMHRKSRQIKFQCSNCKVPL